MKNGIFYQVIALATLNMARAEREELLNHECYNAQPCEDSSYYFNELACECFKIEVSCEVECESGFELDPRQECGCTEEPPIYPEWATEQDKEDFKAEGKLRAEQRPASENWADTWRQYPKENHANDVIECYTDNMYWNELSANCFTMWMCMMWCVEPGTEFNPTLGCYCEDKSTIRESLYPFWATLYDIQQSRRSGEQDFFNRHQVCKYEDLEGEQNCEKNQYYDELACQWFSRSQCKKMCPEGFSLSPFEKCTCLPNAEIEDIYPEWADEHD